MIFSKTLSKIAIDGQEIANKHFYSTSKLTFLTIYLKFTQVLAKIVLQNIYVAKFSLRSSQNVRFVGGQNQY